MWTEHMIVSYGPWKDFEATLSSNCSQLVPVPLLLAECSAQPQPCCLASETKDLCLNTAGEGSKCRGAQHGSCEKHLEPLSAAKAKSTPEPLSHRVWPCGQDSRAASSSPGGPSVQMLQ